jgi:hypothetical protein
MHHLDACQLEWLNQGIQFIIDEKEFYARVLENVVDLLRIKPGVYGNQNATSCWDGKVSLEEVRRVEA